MTDCFKPGILIQQAWHSSLTLGTVNLKHWRLYSLLALNRAVEFGYGTLHSKLGTLVLIGVVAFLSFTHGTNLRALRHYSHCSLHIKVQILSMALQFS